MMLLIDIIITCDAITLICFHAAFIYAFAADFRCRMPIRLLRYCHYFHILRRRHCRRHAAFRRRHAAYAPRFDTPCHIGEATIFATPLRFC